VRQPHGAGERKLPAFHHRDLPLHAAHGRVVQRVDVAPAVHHMIVVRGQVGRLHGRGIHNPPAQGLQRRRRRAHRPPGLQVRLARQEYPVRKPPRQPGLQLRNPRGPHALGRPRGRGGQVRGHALEHRLVPRRGQNQGARAPHVRPRVAQQLGPEVYAGQPSLHQGQGQGLHLRIRGQHPARNGARAVLRREGLALKHRHVRPGARAGQSRAQPGHPRARDRNCFACQRHGRGV